MCINTPHPLITCVNYFMPSHHSGGLNAANLSLEGPTAVGTCES